MSKVFVLQEPTKRDEAGNLVPLMDFSALSEYGEKVVCLPPGRVSLTPGPTVDILTEVLRNFTDDDYIVSVGDPSAIFIAAMVVGRQNRHRCKLLKWDKDKRKYICIQVDLNHRVNQHRTSKGELK